MKDSRQWANLLALFVASALILAACGGGGSKKNAKSSPQAVAPVGQQTSTARVSTPASSPTTAPSATATPKSTQTSTPAAIATPLLTLKPKPTPTPIPRPTPTPNRTPSPTPAPSPTPNVLATAQANHCSVTKPETSSPPSPNSGFAAQWYHGKAGQLWLATIPEQTSKTDVSASSNPLWYTGGQDVVILSANTPNVSGSLANTDFITLQTATSYSNVDPYLPALLPAHTLSIQMTRSGCWDIKVTSGDHTLAITVWVAPYAQRPDIQRQTKADSTLTPYPIPVTCPTTNWYQPQPGENYGIYGEGITLYTHYPVFFAGHATQVFLANNPNEQPKFTGVLPGNTAANVQASWNLYTDQTPQEYWVGQVTFSTPGCWRVEVASKSESVDTTLYIKATIYVYPAGCYHQAGTQVPATCRMP